MSADLSEGELSKSEENGDNSPVTGSNEGKVLVGLDEENGDVVEAGQTPTERTQRKRTGRGRRWREPSERGLDEENGDVVEAGQTPTERTQRKRKAAGEPEFYSRAKKKKKKRNRARSLPSDSEGSSSEAADWEKDVDRFYLKNPEKLVLRHISQLVQADRDWPAFPKYRTIDVRNAVRHLLTGVPFLSQTSKKKRLKLLNERLESLKESKFVVIWLSMVSCSDFSTDRHLLQLKQQPAQIRCVITHPGTNRFVKLGLEAFMKIEHPTRVPCAAEKHVVMQHEFGKADCLLSNTELRLNMFPCDSSTTDGKEVRGFTLTDWPSGNLASNGCAIAQMPLFALDCEMVVTAEGFELARVSIVDEMLKCIFDSLVRPPNPVLDYVTKFSGIDAEMLEDVSTTLEDIQEQVKKLLPASCILVGHSLENDLKALGLSHPYVIDTSLLFTPYATPFCKPKLRMLAKKLLDEEIQTGLNGHCSTEDAIACMKLVQLKLQQGAMLTISWNERNKANLLSEASAHGVAVAMVDKPSITHAFGKGVTCVMAESDEEVIEGARKAIADNRFIFLQLHAAENCLKENDKASQEYNRVLESIDSQVCQIVQCCPSGTLVSVIGGSGYLKGVRKLQKSDCCEFEKLKDKVMDARRGFMVSFLKQ